MLGFYQIKSVRFTFRSRDFPKTLLHLGYFFQNIKLECKTPKVIKSNKAKPGPKKVKTCECSNNKRNIVLRVTRVRGLLILQKRAPENMFFVSVFVFY